MRNILVISPQAYYTVRDFKKSGPDVSGIRAKMKEVSVWK
jgi:hypothetical protein